MFDEKPKRTDNPFNNPFDTILRSDENLLWYGQPDLSRHLDKRDALTIPFSLLWGGFAIFWTLTAAAAGAPFFFVLWGIPFVLMGLYMIFGRFIHKYINKSKTHYAVTDERVIIINTLGERKINSYYLRELPGLNQDGPNLTFGFASPEPRSWNRHTMNASPFTWGSPAAPGFYDLYQSEVDEVYRMLLNLSHEAKKEKRKY